MRSINSRTALALAVPAALLVIACGTGQARDGGSVSASGAAVSASSGSAQATAGVGTGIRDGQFEFTVQKVACGATKVGDKYLNETAQGQFCMVTMKVANIGTEARTFSDSDQHAYGATGAKYDADTTAGLYANENNQAFLTGINPGNSITCVVVFDIPKDGKIAKLELHDSAFSAGVIVTVK